MARGPTRPGGMVAPGNSTAGGPRPTAFPTAFRGPPDTASCLPPFTRPECPPEHGISVTGMCGMAALESGLAHGRARRIARERGPRVIPSTTAASSQSLDPGAPGVSARGPLRAALGTMAAAGGRVTPLPCSLASDS
jgi:hypothetical protein